MRKESWLLIVKVGWTFGGIEKVFIVDNNSFDRESYTQVWKGYVVGMFFDEIIL